MSIRKKRPNVTLDTKPFRVPGPWADKKIADIDDARRRRDYEILGTLSFVNVGVNGELRLIDFRKGSGPTVARPHNMDGLILVTPWEGIPDKIEQTGKFCPRCIQKCDVCGGTGKKLCEAPFCGGAGVQHLPSTHIDGKCNDCPECATCQGTGKAPCSICRGEGQRAMGRIDGALCPECNGAQFQITRTVVDPMQFCMATVGAGMALGPIVRFSVRPLLSAGRTAQTQVFDVTPDYENMPMILLVRAKTPPCQCYLLGGTIREARH